MQNKRTVWAVAAIAVVLVLTGAGIAVALASRTDPPPAAAPGPCRPSCPPRPARRRPPASDINGPLNLLILGIDTRVSIPDWEPHADAIMLLHVDESLESGYLFSLPRDLRVEIPAFPQAGFPGGRYKITEAMSRGSRVPGSDKPNPEQGYELLAADHLRLHRDQDLRRRGGAHLHRAEPADRRARRRDPEDRPEGGLPAPPPGRHACGRCGAGGGGYVGPQATYLPGTRTLNGWQAIDYARQRYTAGGDYTRQRHQRQLVKALLTKAEAAGLATDTAKLQRCSPRWATLLLYSGERSPLEYAYALRDLKPEKLTLVGLPGASVTSGGGYIGEELQPLGRDFLKAVAANEPAAFLAKHPTLINK